MAMGKVVVAAPSAARGLAASQLVTLDMKANPQAVADTILRILADPAERRALELRAFTYARREFGKEAYFNAMDRLFESIGIAAGTRRTKAA
jgi:glycosyltransferase involved in cell wall biosynthesis